MCGHTCSLSQKTCTFMLLHANTQLCDTRIYIHTDAHTKTQHTHILRSVLVYVSVVNMHGWLIHNVASNQAVHLCMTRRYTPVITHILFDIQIQLSVFTKNKDTITHNHNYTHGSRKCHRLVHPNTPRYT